MTRMALTRIFLFSFLFAFCTASTADVLLIQQVRQAGTMDVPVNGLHMGEVEARFGAPQQKRAPVGDPPITRWDYETWSVYFEYDRALYTVLHEGEVIDSANREPIIVEEDGGEAASESHSGDQSGDESDAEAERGSDEDSG